MGHPAPRACPCTHVAWCRASGRTLKHLCNYTYPFECNLLCLGFRLFLMPRDQNSYLVSFCAGNFFPPLLKNNSCWEPHSEHHSGLGHPSHNLLCRHSSRVVIGVSAHPNTFRSNDEKLWTSGFGGIVTVFVRLGCSNMFQQMFADVAVCRRGKLYSLYIYTSKFKPLIDSVCHKLPRLT